MQYNNKDYKPKLHDRWRALTVKNPYATQLVTAAYEDNGIVYGEKCIEVRSKNTPYRGDLMVCSSANPVIAGYESADFTPEDWENTRIPPEKRKSITKGFGWLMRNPRRVVEFPIKGQLGIYNLVYTKGVITEYPRALVVDKQSYELLNRKGNE